MLNWFTTADKIKPGVTFYPLRHPVYFGFIIRRGSNVSEFKYNKVTSQWIKTSRIIDLNTEIK